MKLARGNMNRMQRAKNREYHSPIQSGHTECTEITEYADIDATNEFAIVCVRVCITLFLSIQIFWYYAIVVTLYAMYACK